MKPSLLLIQVIRKLPEENLYLGYNNGKNGIYLRNLIMYFNFGDSIAPESLSLFH